MRSVWPNGLAEMMAQRQQAEHRHDRAELVEMKLRGELEAEDLAARDAAAQALVAAGQGSARR